MICGGVPYYGKLVDIIEINYNGLFTVPLFKCQWADTTTHRGHKKDKLGFTQINFSKLIHTGEKEDDEPYIKASEGQMVFYVDDEKEKGWSIPVHVKPRDLYDMGDDIMSTTDLDSSSQSRATTFTEPGLAPLSLLLTSSAAPPLALPVISFRRLKRMKNDTKGNTTNRTKYTKSFGFEAFRSMVLM